MCLRIVGFPPLPPIVICRDIRQLGCFCTVWLVALGVLLGAPASGTGGAPVHVLTAPPQGAELTWVESLSYGASSNVEASGNSGGNFVRREDGRPLTYRRQRTACRQLPTRFIITMALAAIVLLILLCAFPQAKPRAMVSRRSLAESDDGLQACNNPSDPSPETMDPEMHDKARSLLLLQEKVSGSCWKAIPKMASLHGLKTVSVFLSYATMEMTVLSAFLSDDLERQKKDVASQFYSLARYVIQHAPRKEPHMKFVYRLRRMARIFGTSRLRHAQLPPMPAEERAHLLNQLLAVQHVTWNLINDAMQDLAQWTETGDGNSLERISGLVLSTICGALRSRRSHLLRIPAAVHCLHELQVAAGLKLIFGQEGLRNAAECGPLPGTEAQIAEVEQEVSYQRAVLLSAEAIDEDEEDQAEGAFPSGYFPGGLASPMGPPLSYTGLVLGTSTMPGTEAPLSSPAFPPMPLYFSFDSESRTLWGSEGFTSGASSDTQGASQTELHLVSGGLRGWTVEDPTSSTSTTTQKPLQNALPAYLGGYPGWIIEGPISSTSSTTPSPQQTALPAYLGGYAGWAVEGPIYSTSTTTPSPPQTALPVNSGGYPGWIIEGPISCTSSTTPSPPQTALPSYSGGYPGWTIEGLIPSTSTTTPSPPQTALPRYSGGYPGWIVESPISSTSSTTPSPPQTALPPYSGVYPGWKVGVPISSTPFPAQGASQTALHPDSTDRRPGWKVGGPISSASRATQDTSQTALLPDSRGLPGWKIGGPVSSMSSATEGASQTALPSYLGGHQGWKTEGPISSTSSTTQSPPQTPLRSYSGSYPGRTIQGPISSTSTSTQGPPSSATQDASQTALRLDSGGLPGWKIESPIASTSSATQSVSETGLYLDSAGRPGSKIEGPISSTSSDTEGASETALHLDGRGHLGWRSGVPLASTPSATQGVSPTALASYWEDHSGWEIEGPISSTPSATQGAPLTVFNYYLGGFPGWRDDSLIPSASPATGSASVTARHSSSGDDGSISSTSSASQGASRIAVHYYSMDPPGWEGEGSTSSTSPATEGASHAALHHEHPLLGRDDFGSVATTEAAGLSEGSDHHRVSDGERKTQLSPRAATAGIFYGVPLGAPAGPWPPEGARRPDDAKTPFDFGGINLLTADFNDIPSEDSQGQRRQVNP